MKKLLYNSINIILILKYIFTQLLLSIQENSVWYYATFY